MRFKSPLEAGRHAKGKREEITPNSPDMDGRVRHIETIERDSPTYKYIFTLQEEIGESGATDYHEYARRFWRNIAGENAKPDSEPFRMFEHNLIAGLHDIPMRELVYKHVLQAMPTLIEKYHDSIKHLSLWSKGDVSATGYQTAKIESSRIAHEFMREVARQIPQETRRSFLEQKTSYDIADDKFQDLVGHIGEALGASNGKIKVVIIEDSYKNFAAAKQAIRDSLGDKAAERVDVEPIWVVYSREGINMREKEGVSMKDFKEKYAKVRPIESFEELIDEARFEELFKDAHVFVDFDGVIGDNLRMRDAQANVTLTAAIDGLSREWNLGRGETRQRIEKILSGAL